MEKKYDDSIAHFKEVACKMTEEKELKKKITFSFCKDSSRKDQQALFS
ncbi:MAG: hypothetical protein WDA29_11640 [Flavobacteriaceae bacterium]